MNTASIPGDRGFTNLLTGSVHLLDIPSNTLFKYIVETKLPYNFLPSFLHEATHYWCMASDLGSALALLELRQYHAIYQITVDHKDLSPTPDHSQLIHDKTALMVAREILQPLLEGMALFQEFDAFPGKSNVWSTPAFWAANLFQPLEQKPPTFTNGSERIRWLTDQIYQVLAGYRAGRHAKRRKTSILMQSLTGDEHSYLAGYLTVKNLWNHAAAATPAFQDRDLFLTFLRFWIFQDWVIIDYLLDDDLAGDVMAHLVSDRIQERLVAIISEDLSSEVDVFDREVGSGTNDPSEMRKCLRIADHDLIAARQKMDELMQAIYHGMENGDHSDWFIGDLFVIEHRNKLLRLQIEPVFIDVNQYQRAIVSKTQGDDVRSVYIAGPAPEGCEQGKTTGWLMVYFIPEEMRLMVLASRSNRPVIWLSMNENGQDRMENYRVMMTKVSVMEEGFRQMAPMIDEEMELIKDEVYVDLVRRFPVHVRELYQNYALSFVSREEHVPEIVSQLERKGFYDFLNRDGDLLTALVEISLVPALSVHTRDKVREELAQVGIDLDQSIQKIQEIQNQRGMPLLYSDGSPTIWCSV